MYVTFVIRAGETGPVTLGSLDIGDIDDKSIAVNGITSNLRLRNYLERLQLGNVETLQYEAVFDADKRLVRRLAEQWQERRIRGAWYSPDVLDITTIEAPRLDDGDFNFARRDSLRALVDPST